MKPMDIGIIADRIDSQGGGVETYELGLLKGLMQLDRQNSYKVYCGSDRTLSGIFSGHKNFHAKAVAEKSKYLRFTVGITAELLKDKLDIVHVCMIPPLIMPCRYVLTVHDLGPWVYPEHFPKMMLHKVRFLFKKGPKQAVKLISDSEATKRDLVSIFDIDPDKVTVVHLGIDKCYGPIKDKARVDLTLKKYGIRGKYILYVGKIQARKNTARLVEAFDILKKQTGIEHKLVMVGRKMWKSEDTFERINKSPNRKDIKYLGHIDHADLPHLYNGADVFVFPSLFEGFGLPPLEAMACGVPVVASNSSSLPEVVGDAGLMVDPHDAAGFADKIALILQDNRLKEKLIRRGLAWASTFTWEKTARKTLDVYQEICDAV